MPRSEKAGIAVRPRIRVLRNSEIVMGPGKAELLRHIAETKSLSESARRGGSLTALASGYRNRRLACVELRTRAVAVRLVDLQACFPHDSRFVHSWIPLAHWLNVSRWRGMLVVETLVTLQIVLPPTVIGFCLLVLFAPHNPFGRLWIELTGHTLAFSFSGLVVGSIIYSLPFAVQPFQAALKAVPYTLIEAARISAANFLQVFWYVTLPIARRGIARGHRVELRAHDG